MVSWVVNSRLHKRPMRLRHSPRLHLRHRDENPVTASPLDSALTNCDARNSFRIRFYENCRVSSEFAAKISEESGPILSHSNLSEKPALPKPFEFRALRTLSFSLACKSFACHYYKKDRAVAQLFPKWNSILSGLRTHSALGQVMSHGSPVRSHLSGLTPSASADTINSSPTEPGQ